MTRGLIELLSRVRDDAGQLVLAVIAMQRHISVLNRQRLETAARPLAVSEAMTTSSISLGPWAV